MNGDTIVKYRPYLLKVLIDLDANPDWRYDDENHTNFRAYRAAISSDQLYHEVQPMDLTQSIAYAERLNKWNALKTLRQYKEEIDQG